LHHKLASLSILNISFVRKLKNGSMIGGLMVVSAHAALYLIFFFRFTNKKDTNSEQLNWQLLKKSCLFLFVDVAPKFIVWKSRIETHYLPSPTIVAQLKKVELKHSKTKNVKRQKPKALRFLLAIEFGVCGIKTRLHLASIHYYCPATVQPLFSSSLTNLGPGSSAVFYWSTRFRCQT
jgi:MFS-type transporter involved in bile tolerance (Atg22 family)